MASPQPKFSIITPSFNQGEFIKQTIESVLAQQYPAIEHIVIDAGSKDGTVDILKSYDHLIWVSEPDRGQTHALNKGFRRATGDYVAWINADDWYAPNVFGELADSLRNHPVVMGTCQFTDKEGNVTESVLNIERNWYDLLKYWIYYASPAQPSVFFRRDALESVRLSNGDYLDEDLHYCMDFELWLRLGRKFPFTKRLDRVIAYFRNYDTNKSGQDMAASYREDSRVFRRYCNSVSNAERRVSYVLPLTELGEREQSTLKSLCSQSLRDIELLCVDYNGDTGAGRSLRQQISKMDHDIPQLTIRYARSEDSSLVAAYNKGVSAACAPLVAFCEAGTLLSPEFSLSVSNLFEADIFGAALPLHGQTELSQYFTTELEGRRLFNFHTVFSPKTLGLHFVARKIALLEVGPIAQNLAPLFLWRTIFSRLLYKGWHISVDNSLSCAFGTEFPFDDEIAAAFSSYIAARLIVDTQNEYERDSFGKVRAQHGFAMMFPSDAVQNARRLLENAPSGWEESRAQNDSSWIEQSIAKFPSFSPAWYLKACLLKTQSKDAEAKVCFEKFQSLRSSEKL